MILAVGSKPIGTVSAYLTMYTPCVATVARPTEKYIICPLFYLISPLSKKKGA